MILPPPHRAITEVQRIDAPGAALPMRRLLGRDVTVRLSEPMAAFNGHHHRPLLAWVEQVLTVSPPVGALPKAARMPEPPPRPAAAHALDELDEGGLGGHYHPRLLWHPRLL
jgi:hypothetical protein